MTVTAVTQRRRRIPAWQHALHIVLVLVLVAAIVYGAAAAFAPAPAAQASAVEVDVAPGPEPVIDWPTDARAAAYGVVGIDGARGSWGSETQHPMASITKVVTVLTVLDAFPLEGGDRGPSITMTQDDVDLMALALADNAPIFPVRVGTVVTQRDLVEYALVDSCANAAMSLAHWAFGDADGFVDAAEAFTAANGMPDIDAAEPAGLDARSVATAIDLATLALMAVQTPVVLETMQLEEVRIPGIGMAPSTNRLLGQAGIDAGKTGTLKVWGRNMLFSSVQEIDGVERRVVGIVMGTISEDETDAASLQLLESIWPNITERELVPAGTVVGAYETAWGESATVTTADPTSGTAWGAQTPEVTVDLMPLEIGARVQQVGTVATTIGGETVEVDAVADGILLPPDLWWRVTHPSDVIGWLTSQAG